MKSRLPEERNYWTQTFGLYISDNDWQHCCADRGLRPTKVTRANPTFLPDLSCALSLEVPLNRWPTAEQCFVLSPRCPTFFAENQLNERFRVNSRSNRSTNAKNRPNDRIPQHLHCRTHVMPRINSSIVWTKTLGFGVHIGSVAAEYCCFNFSLNQCQSVGLSAIIKRLSHDYSLTHC